MEQKYNPNEIFPLDSLITHPIFGTGKVIKYIHPNKMDVDFGSEVRCFVCGRLPLNLTANNSLPHGQPRDVKNKNIHTNKTHNDITHEVMSHEKTAKSAPKIDSVNIEQKSTQDVIQKPQQSILKKASSKFPSDCLIYSRDCIFPLNSLILDYFLGVGKVIKHIPPNQMDVEFEDGLKRLECRCPTTEPHIESAKSVKFSSIPSVLADFLVIVRQKYIDAGYNSAPAGSLLFNHAKGWKQALLPSVPFYTAGLPLPGGTNPALCSMIQYLFPRDYCGLANGRQSQFSGKYVWLFDINNKGKNKAKEPVVQIIQTPEQSTGPGSNQPVLAHITSQAADRLPLGQVVTPSADEIAKSEPVFDSVTTEQLKKVLSSHFSNGYRTASNIYFDRFKNFYASEFGVEFTSEADKLDMFISSVAVIFEDRAYVYNDAVPNDVQSYLERMESPCIYIDIFFEKYSKELYAFGIFSIDILKAFIKKNYIGISCKDNYIYLQSDASPDDLIRSVFDEREIWSYDELSERLPCISSDTIRQALSRSDYVRVDANSYTHIDNIDLPDSEGTKVFASVSERLQSRDYVIANELDLSKFININPHCPFLAIRDAVFNKFLSSSYDKRGQVITHKGVKLNVSDILEQYCRAAETVSLDELNKLEASFDPSGIAYSHCLTAAYRVMVRVSDALFVADNKVSFDIGKTDEVLSLYCREDFLPLKSVADFSLFPYPGYQWNLFLLESFLRKYSRLFKYIGRAVNSANIGVISRKASAYSDYDDILAIALAKSPISLSDKREFGDYLVENGYIGRRNLGNNEEEILTKAKRLREEGVV